MVNFSWSRRTEGCKILPACLNFSGLAPASLSDQPEPAKSAIFGKIGGKTINLARTFLHNGVRTDGERRECGRIQRLCVPIFINSTDRGRLGLANFH